MQYIIYVWDFSNMRNREYLHSRRGTNKQRLGACTPYETSRAGFHDCHVGHHPEPTCELYNTEACEGAWPVAGGSGGLAIRSFSALEPRRPLSARPLRARASEDLQRTTHTRLSA